MVPTAIEKTLKALTMPAGILNQGILDIFKLIDPQGLCTFEVIFVPKKSLWGSENASVTPAASQSPAGSAAFITNPLKKLNSTAMADQAIATFLVDAITASFSAFEYERIGNNSYITGITHPEEITITFIEPEMSLVRLWLNAWQNEIIKISDDGRVLFKDNQNGSKKDCYIIPQGKMGLPNAVGIKLNGLKLKGIGEIEFSQSSPEIMRLPVTFSIDNSWFRLITDIV